METTPTSPICPPDWTPPSGDEVRAAIQAAGWTQVAVARALRLGERTVRDWCSGQSTPSWPVWYAVQALLAQAPEKKIGG